MLGCTSYKILGPETKKLVQKIGKMPPSFWLSWNESDMTCMELMTDELRKQFPPLGAMDGKRPMDVPIVAKYFTPDSNWTWWAYEFDGEDLFFGLVQGFETEFGYFSLSELKSVKGPLGLPIEMDLYFDEKTLADVLAELGKGDDDDEATG
jgi:hypothetical protein